MYNQHTHETPAQHSIQQGAKYVSQAFHNLNALSASAFRLLLPGVLACPPQLLCASVACLVLLPLLLPLLLLPQRLA